MTDLISRKHALRVAKDLEDGNVPVAMIVALIDAIPSADAVQGEWIYEGMPTCSICGKWIDVLQGTAKLNFCPNCGARMENKK